MADKKTPDLAIVHSDPELTPDQQHEIKAHLRPLASALHRFGVKSLEVENPAASANNKPTLTITPTNVAAEKPGP